MLADAQSYGKSNDYKQFLRKPTTKVRDTKGVTPGVVDTVAVYASLVVFGERKVVCLGVFEHKYI